MAEYIHKKEVERKMNIFEAIKARTREQPFITREAWEKVILSNGESSIYIQPTDTPEGCLLYGPSKRGPRGGWTPAEGDLIAQDWKPVRGF